MIQGTPLIRTDTRYKRSRSIVPWKRKEEATRSWRNGYQKERERERKEERFPSVFRHPPTSCEATFKAAA